MFIVKLHHRSKLYQLLNKIKLCAVSSNKSEQFNLVCNQTMLQLPACLNIRYSSSRSDISSSFDQTNDVYEFIRANGSTTIITRETNGCCSKLRQVCIAGMRRVRIARVVVWTKGRGGLVETNGRGGRRISLASGVCPMLRAPFSSR